MPRKNVVTALQRALTRRGVIAAVSLGMIALLWQTAHAAPRYGALQGSVGQPPEGGILPGAIWQRSEFFDGHSGTCGETALAMAESWAFQHFVSPEVIYARMANAGLMVSANGDSTNEQLAREASNDGLRIDVLPYDEHNFPLDNDTWRTFVNKHIYREAIVLQVHNGQALVNVLTGMGENAYQLQNHVIVLVGFHQDGYSPLAGEYLPTGWWTVDGAALGQDHHLQFYTDDMLAASEPFAGIAIYAHAAMPGGSTLPTQPEPNQPTATDTPGAAAPTATAPAAAATTTPSTTTNPSTTTPPTTNPPTQQTAAPTSPFFAGLTGYDISWPQCGQANPQADSLAVIGVTGGMADVESADPARHAHDHNPCLQEQWQWASANALAPMVYINTANPPVNQTAQQAYLYGYNTAANAYAFATQEGVISSVWWLDVETGNSWSADKDANFASLRGDYDYLTQHGLTVGIYSTAYQWGVIAGTHAIAGIPIWLAGPTDAATALDACADAKQRFAGGVPWLVQYPRGQYDGDISCGATH